MMKNYKVVQRLIYFAIAVSFNIWAAPVENVSLLETSDFIPELDRLDSLAGLDANKNGVRDDIDVYIQITFKTALQRLAVSQAARALQSAVLVDATDANAALAVSQHIAKSINCMSSRFSDNQGSLSPGAVWRRLEAITVNTKIRITAYLAYDKSQVGYTTSLPKGDTCE